MFLPQIPQVGHFAPLDGTGIGHIKNIFQAGTAAALVDQGNPFGVGFHPPPHRIIPQLHAGAGGGVRALGVDQELVSKGIFLKLLSRGIVRFAP